MTASSLAQSATRPSPLSRDEGQVRTRARAQQRANAAIPLLAAHAEGRHTGCHSRCGLYSRTGLRPSDRREVHMDRRILDDPEFRIADRDFEDVLIKVRPEELQSELREKYEA